MLLFTMLVRSSYYELTGLAILVVLVLNAFNFYNRLGEVQPS